MAQYDILLYQNVSPSAVLFKEQFVNIAKGCILSADSNGVPTVLSAGTNDFVLTADSTTPTGLKWSAAGSSTVFRTDATTFSTRGGIGAGNTETQGAARYNTYLGYRAGYTATAATSNVAIGYMSGFYNTGSGNVHMGRQAGYLQVAGDGNVYIGDQCGYTGGSGDNNCCIGQSAGYNLTGSDTVIIGSGAGLATGAASYNVFVGKEAGKKNTTGTNNTYIGYLAGYTSNTVSYNVAIGNSAGCFETVGYKLFIDGLNRTDEATARTNSMIYGIFNATPTSQELWLNAKVYMNKLGSATTSYILYIDDTTGLLTKGASPSGISYPGSGIANSTGSSWGTSYTTTGSGTVVALQTSPSITTSLITASTSFDLLNTTATTINFAGAATTLTIGYTSTAASTINISTGNVASGNSKTINIGTGGQASSSTNVNIGCQTSGVQPGTLTLGGFDTVVHSSNRTSLTLFNANTTTLTMAGAAETINISSDAITATQIINIGTGSTGTQTINIGTGTTASGYARTLNFGTGGASGSYCYIYFGSTNANALLSVHGSVYSYRGDGYSGLFVYTGTTTTQTVLLLKHGATSGTTIKMLQAQDGNSYNRGYINMNITTSVLTFVSGSDERIKTNISKTKMDALNIVNNIPVKDFNFKEKPKDPLITGFMAQDVDKYFPEAVSYDKENDKWDLAWGYSMNPLYHKAIQELTDKIKQLETEIQTLKS